VQRQNVFVSVIVVPPPLGGGGGGVVAHALVEAVIDDLAERLPAVS
jgi:hypothetical protein